MNNGVACIFCGGETRVEVESDCGRYITQRRRCLVCKMAFEASKGKDGGGSVCTVDGCPERPSCLLKYEAQRCAVYRSVAMRGMPVQR